MFLLSAVKLVELGHISRENLTRIKDQFVKLDRTKSGFLEFDDIKSMSDRDGFRIDLRSRSDVEDR